MPFPPASPLLAETFDAAGYDNAGWTESGAPNEDYTTTILDGTASFRCLGSFDSVYSYHTFTGGSERWGFFKVRPVNLGGATTIIFQFWNNVAAAMTSVEVNSSGTVTVRCGSANATTVATMSTGTTYNLWTHYLKGTGLNAAYDVSFSTDGTRPTSGNNFAGNTNGTSTGDTVEMMLGVINFSGSPDFIFDLLYIDDAQIDDLTGAAFIPRTNKPILQAVNRAATY